MSIKTKRKPLSEAEKAKRDAAKAAKFRELANKRVPRALKAIELIGNLAGPGYASTDEQVQAIRDAISEAVIVAMDRFDRTSKDGPTFQL